MESKIVYAGNTTDPKQALILIHGRGAAAEDILPLAEELHVAGFLLAAPTAAAHSWYPYSFLAPAEKNEPALSVSLAVIHRLVQAIEARGISKTGMYFSGFSQGACLGLEYTARHAARYGGIVAFTGGLIGDRLAPENYAGDFAGTPVFISTGDPDPHVPPERVRASADLLRCLGAAVRVQVYPNRGHTISSDELALANETVFGNYQTPHSKKI